MNHLDYRKLLGLGFSDEEKSERFYAQIYNFFLNASDSWDTFDELVEQSFCNKIGMQMEKQDDIYNLLEERKGLQRPWIYLSKRKENFLDFLTCFVALINTYAKGRKEKRILTNVLLDALEDCKIEYETRKDKDDLFIIPKGAKEFDDALVSKPLEWLIKYPKAYKTFCTALQQYSDGIYIRDVADNLRKALEEFLREFLGNDCDFNKNKKWLRHI